jgi:hypothetical protein
MNYLTRVYMMICGKETDDVEEEEKGVDLKDDEDNILDCGCFSSLKTRKKTLGYKKHIKETVEMERDRRETVSFLQYIRSLPEELKLYILSYTQQPQPPALLKDIQNFHLTHRFLFNVICKKNPRKIINRILTFYDSSILYNNISPIVARKIQRWQRNHRITKVIDDFIIIEYPNILKIFNKDNKHILLWGILPPVYRNKYLNFLYSVMDIETDEEEQGGDAPPAVDPANNSTIVVSVALTLTPNNDTDTDTNPDTDLDANPAPDTDTDLDANPAPDTDTDPETAPDTDESPDPDTDAAPRCPVYFA